MKTVVDHISKLQFICQTLFTATQLGTFEYAIRAGMAKEMVNTAATIREVCVALNELIEDQTPTDNA